MVDNNLLAIKILLSRSERIGFHDTKHCILIISNKVREKFVNFTHFNKFSSFM